MAGTNGLPDKSTELWQFRGARGLALYVPISHCMDIGIQKPLLPCEIQLNIFIDESSLLVSPLCKHKKEFMRIMFFDK